MVFAEQPPSSFHDWPAVFYVIGLIFLAWQAQRAARDQAHRDKEKSDKLNDVKQAAINAAKVLEDKLEASENKIKQAALDAAATVAREVAEVKETLARTNGYAHPPLSPSSRLLSHDD